MHENDFFFLNSKRVQWQLHCIFPYTNFLVDVQKSHQKSLQFRKLSLAILHEMWGKLDVRRSPPVSHVRFNTFFFSQPSLFIKGKLFFSSMQDFFFQKKNMLIVIMNPRNELINKVTLQIQSEKCNQCYSKPRTQLIGC